MATPAIAFAQLAGEIEAEGINAQNGVKIGTELAKTFGVHADEVAVLKLERSHLHFVYPEKLHQVGSIPVNTSTSVAARTANTKRAEAINNFAQTKHASVFESVELGAKKQESLGQKPERHLHVIQKLMSVPVMGAAGVVGVIQISRKGESAPAAGADFTQMDLQKLVAIATSLSKCFK